MVPNKPAAQNHKTTCEPVLWFTCLPVGWWPRRIRARHVADAVSSGCCLAVALGGGSDCIGALALARALGYEDIVVVMPSSGKSGGSKVVCEPVSAAEAPALPPGGDFYSNDTMLAYLLSLPIGLRPTVAKFLVQPKDDGDPRTGGFSLASLNATTDALLALARAHQCTAIVGLDFGGDVVLPDPRRASGVSSGPFIKRRDSLNCHAVGEAARKLGVPATIVVSAPGVDAAAVAPEYARRLGGPGGATVRVFAMGADEANPCSLAPVPGPAP
eukprot:jgi/Chrpa1/20610/Chrysochromulina_OHIO_Genome00021772-RA